jgi:protein MpaA
VLRALTLALFALGGSPEPAHFENAVYGHTVVVPPGWTAQLAPPSLTTDVASFRPKRLDRWERPPPEHVRLSIQDYGRLPCPRAASLPGQPVRLVGPAHFEGFFGYTAVFCRRGHSLQGFLLVGRAVASVQIEQARQLLASLHLTPRANEVASSRSVRMLGRSHEGRAIRVVRVGNPRSRRRALVIGCIHGNECAGMAVTQRLVSVSRPIAADVWVLQNLNPDGLAHGTRGNARGVDLNRDFDTFSQRETRIARDLIRRIRPEVTIWFHQPQALVRAWGDSRRIARRYARLARAPYRSLEWPPGAATRWQNSRGELSFVVELPAGALSDAAANRYAEAVLRLEDPLCCGR